MSYEIKRLLPRHYKVMDLHLLGMKQVEIAKELDLSVSAVSSIIKSKIFQAELPKRKLEVQNTRIDDEEPSAAELLQDATIRSAKILCEMLNSEDDRVALRAAQDILDRSG